MDIWHCVWQQCPSADRQNETLEAKHYEFVIILSAHRWAQRGTLSSGKLYAPMGLRSGMVLIFKAMGYVRVLLWFGIGAEAGLFL